MERFEAGGDVQEPSLEANEANTRVIGAAIEVHRQLGPGFLETVYETAMCVELDRRAIRYERQVRLPIRYRGVTVGEHVLDLVVEGVLVVELKCVAAISPIHLAQVISYMKAADLTLGSILNFNVPALRDGGIKRVVWGRRSPDGARPRAEGG